MKKTVAKARDRIHATRQWIFRWRGLDGTPLRGALALLITFGGFALFAATVRIRVSAPQQWVERKASIIHLPADGEGGVWALRAQEGGPYPARFDSAAWEKTAGLTSGLIGTTRLSATPYQPKLRELPPENPVTPVDLANRNERVFPKRSAPVDPVVPPVASVPVPVLYPLSGITSDEIPAILPAFEAAKAGQVLEASGPADFLLRLSPDGTVLDAIGLPEKAGGEALRQWLLKVNFGPAAGKKSPFVGIGVGFTNQSQSADGPDPR